MMLLLAGFLLTAASGLGSQGIYHEDDLKHFLFARWSKHDASYLIDEWGRPGFTVPYALPAMIGSAATGWHACRLLSALLSAATAWLAYRIARHYRLRHAWVAIPLLYLQPLFTHLSLTTLTETPLAFYIALAAWLLLKQRPISSAAVIALAPITRHEAIVLLPLWALAMYQSRAHWSAYAAMFWAMVAHNVLSLPILHELPIRVFIAPQGSTQYGTGTPLTFLPRLLLATGPVVLALAVMGARRLIARSHGWLIVAAPALYFVAETAIYMRGAYSSGGYARFLVPISPCLAILAAAGAQPFFLARRPAIRLRALLTCGALVIALWAVCEIEWYLRPPGIPQNWRLAAIAGRTAAAGFCVILAAALYRIRRTGLTSRKTPSRRFVTLAAAVLLVALPIRAILPLRLLPQHRIMRDAAAVFEQRGWNHRPLIAVNYWIYHWTGRWVPRELPKWHEALARAEPGTLFAWDARFCPEPDVNLTCAELSDHPQWRLLWSSVPGRETTTPFLAIFELARLSGDP